MINNILIYHQLSILTFITYNSLILLINTFIIQIIIDQLNNKKLKEIQQKNMFTKTHLIQYRHSIQNRQKFMHHLRYQSQPSNKITPWDIIGQALTQRYNQKFRKINQQINCTDQYSGRLCSVENNKKQDNQKNVCDLMRTHQPKFVIKRKYLSFDGKKNEDSHHSNKRNTVKNQCYNINNKTKEDSYNSSTEHKKQLSYSKKSRNYQSIDHENILSQEIVSAMIVPNTVRGSGASKSKYKCIYVKRNRKKLNINPELRISLKKTEAKEIEHNKQKIGKFIQPEKLKKMQILYYGSMIKKDRKKEQKIIKINQQKQKKKEEKKMFRPWSGYQSEQN